LVQKSSSVNKYCSRSQFTVIGSRLKKQGEKKSIQDFQRFINIAQGSAAELRTQVHISQEVNIFSDLDAKELI